MSHYKFARRTAAGLLSQTQAYLLTYPKCRSRAAAASAASRLKRHSNVQSYYQKFRREQAEFFQKQQAAARQREDAIMNANLARMLQR